MRLTFDRIFSKEKSVTNLPMLLSDDTNISNKRRANMVREFEESDRDAPEQQQQRMKGGKVTAAFLWLFHCSMREARCGMAGQETVRK
jgi:hypothetical protein